MKNVKKHLKFGHNSKRCKTKHLYVENFLVLCTLLIWFFVDSKLYHKNDCIPTFRLECSRFLFGLFFTAPLNAV